MKRGPSTCPGAYLHFKERSVVIMGASARIVFHGGFQMVVWLYMIPTSVYIIQGKLQNYLTYHQRLNIAAALTVLVAILFVAVGEGDDDRRRLDEDEDGDGDGIDIQHNTTGWVLFAMLYLQLFVGLLRPSKESQRRTAWISVHKILGFVIPLFGFCQIVTGCMWAGDSLGVVLGVFIPLVLLLHGLTYVYYFKAATKEIDDVNDMHGAVVGIGNSSL